MVFQIAVLVIIPIILTIVTVSPFDEPIEQEIEEIPPEEVENDIGFAVLVLMSIWLLFLIRILYQLRKGTFRIQTKF